MTVSFVCIVYDKKCVNDQVDGTVHMANTG